jgi:adenylate kinase
MRRLTGRRTCSKCGEIYNVNFSPPAVDGVCDRDGGALVIRSDDNEEAVSRRLDEYEGRTAPLVEFYRQRGQLVEVDGNQSVDGVATALVSALPT